MPGFDGTGPMGRGRMTGGRRGRCATPAGGESCCGRGGHGHRDQFHATGLYGWQRAAQTATVPEAVDAVAPEPAPVESVLEDVLKRLERLERAVR